MALNSTEPQKIYLKDYQAPLFEVKSLFLSFQLFEEKTLVASRFETKHHQNLKADMWLDGEDLKLISVQVNGETPEYSVEGKGLKIKNVPAEATIEIKTEIHPETNTSLEGLYKSNGIFCTQCEAQGFRKITYFFDRPDVMTQYTVQIESDRAQYPFLLSNGDRISEELFANGRHQVTWQDPHKKPCYLFALVAGNLGLIKDEFQTLSGKKVSLEIYAPHGQQDRCHHAMTSLKKSMKWDEERFGREYDLATYMIVSIDDFNAGAMENKGLNVFNSRLVLADSKSATDADYFQIESVIAHEYFHNWTGNRVTLRDWFHLSLKEGLTVFRDQEFSMDQSSRALIRIENVADLRSSQFAEDAGPNAHPIRPQSCFAVDNFFTSTIYEKGSEVIRMMQTMVGRPGFRKGMDRYFELYDGKAVVIEDFASAIASANQQDWEQFKLWYSQAGTPHVHVKEFWNTAKKTYTLTLRQSCALTAQESLEVGQNNFQKKPFHIPLVIGLLDSSGKDMTLECSQVVKNTEGQSLIHLTQENQSFEFTHVTEKPALSLNRGFSAPVFLHTEDSFENLLFLMSHDSDAFNRWEASQKIYQRAFHRLVKIAIEKGSVGPDDISSDVVQAFLSLFTSRDLDCDLLAHLITLPSLDYLAQQEDILDAQAFSLAQETLKKTFAVAAQEELLKIYETWHGKNLTSLDPLDFGRRRLKNRALSYLSFLPQYHALVYEQLTKSAIMTDQQAAFAILLDLQSPLRKQAIEYFYEQWKNETLVLNKWFAHQAISDHPDTLETVKTLLQHPDFQIKNPNRVYSLLRNFGDNLTQFHRLDQNAYSFMADQIKTIDQLNPQVAARVAGCFDVWMKLPEGGKAKVRKELDRLLKSGLSKNTHEIILKAKEADKN